MSPKEPASPVVQERRASRRNPIQVRLQLADMVSSFLGRSMDVLGPRGEMVFAVGVVVRCFSDLEGSHEGSLSPGMAIALTSTSEAWDRFWEDVRMTDGEEDEAGDDEDEA